LRKEPYRILLIALLLALPGIAIYGQGDRGRVEGHVKDATGALVPGVTIKIHNERTGEDRTTLSIEEGTYIFNGLMPSAYSIETSLSGFAPTTTKLEVFVGQTRTLDLTIRPANTGQSVSVEATIADSQIDSGSTSLGASVDLREVQQLPINGRNLSQLYLQAPGAQNTGAGNYGDIRFNGRAVEQNAIRYDGIESTGIIDAAPGVIGGELASPFRLQSSLENVQEFRVESNNYPAELGTGTGGQISVVTKSGSNGFHGSIFEYLRNDALDARNTFDMTKPALRMNQFGGSIGGPIIKNKAFFFGSYEGYRLRSGVNFIEAVPSAFAKSNAVAAVQPLFDAFRDPAAVVLPGASTDPNFDIVQLLTKNIVDENSASMRLDYNLNTNNKIYVRFFRDQATTTQPQSVSGRILKIRTTPQNGVLSWQSIISPTKINEVKIGFNEALTRGQGIGNVVNGIDTSGISVAFGSAAPNSGIPGQGTSTGSATAGGLVRLNSQANGRGAPYTPWSISYIDNFSWFHGKHNMKFGGELRQVRMYTDRNGGITYTYPNLGAFQTNSPSNIRYTADLSDPSVFNPGATGERKAEQNYYIGYAQDEWHLRSNVTLNYGLRYEYYSPLLEANNYTVQFDSKTGTLFPADHTPYTAVKTNFGPRIGLSYSPMTKTALRGGFGIFYGPGQTEDLIQPIESDLINTVITGSAYPLDVAATRANFINNPNNRAFAPRAYSADYKVPERIYQYNVSWQQELPGKFVTTVAYVGSQGRNLFLRTITNRIVSVEGSTGFVTREFDIPQGVGVRPLTPYAEIDMKTSGGVDSYNALQISVTKRSSNGLTLNSQYTLGKSYGTSAGSNEGITASNNAQTLSEYDFDKGYNSFDVRHNFNTSAVYMLPFGGGANKKDLGTTANAILGGWEVGTILNARSGVPINVLITRPDIVWLDPSGNVFQTQAAAGGAGVATAVINTPGGGNTRGTRRPDLIAGVDPIIQDGGRVYINPAAFTTPKPGTFGNFPRNGLHGPSVRQADLILNRKFRTSESTNFEFRTEFFNIFNVTNYANPASTLPNALGTTAGLIQPGQPFASTTSGIGTFGKIGGTVEKSVGLGTSRQIQFALKFNF
jgi:hypothetical protein